MYIYICVCVCVYVYIYIMLQSEALRHPCCLPVLVLPDRIRIYIHRRCIYKGEHRKSKSSGSDFKCMFLTVRSPKTPVSFARAHSS